jgi:Spy/CpxP family protein refolding chaperone
MRALCTVLALAAALAVCAKLHAQGARERLAERIQDLSLTAEQETKIADIRKECRPKVEAAAKELAALAKDELEKVRAALTPAQKTKLETLREERQEHRAEGLAERIAHLEDLDLTDAEVAKIKSIRTEYHPKIEKAMEGLRGTLTEQQRAAREEALRAGKNRREVLAALNLTGAQKEKVEAVGKEVATLVREELEKIRDVLTEGQQEKVAELRAEHADRVRDRMAARIANLRDLNLTDATKAAIADIRQQFQPKIHAAGNKLRADVREEVDRILAALKG